MGEVSGLSDHWTSLNTILYYLIYFIYLKISYPSFKNRSHIIEFMKPFSNTKEFTFFSLLLIVISCNLCLDCILFDYNYLLTCLSFYYTVKSLRALKISYSSLNLKCLLLCLVCNLWSINNLFTSVFSSVNRD